MPLLSNADVRALIPQEDLSDDQLAVTMRMVAGWLREDAGLTDLPDPLPDTHALWSPALELVALVASNPTSLASKTVGPTSRTWPLAKERDAIRARVRSLYSGTAAGSFPDPQPWPDPSRVWRTGVWWSRT